MLSAAVSAQGMFAIVILLAADKGGGAISGAFPSLGSFAGIMAGLLCCKRVAAPMAEVEEDS